MREVASQVLRSAGHRVLAAGNAVEAIAALHGHANEFHMGLGPPMGVKKRLLRFTDSK